MSENEDAETVRPTRRTLQDLGVSVPSLEIMLHDVDHQHVREMQKMPERVAAGGVDRIRSLLDRTWIKYKSTNVRAAVTKLAESEVVPGARPTAWVARWWVGAAGVRKSDSPKDDFYANLQAEFGRNGNSSDCLLPVQWDEDRLKAELAVYTVESLRHTVRRLVKLSMTSGLPTQAEAMNHYIQAQVTRTDEIYLTLGTGGVYDVNVVAVILNSVPGVSSDDWFIEPSDALAFRPESGEIVWSTILPIETQRLLMEEDE